MHIKETACYLLMCTHTHIHTHSREKTSTFSVFDMVDPDSEAFATEELGGCMCGCVYVCMVGGYQGV